MKRLYHIFTCSLTSTANDICLLRLASWSVGVGVLVLVAITLPRHAVNHAELALGLGLAVLNCLISVMYGMLAPRVQLTGEAMKWPWRSGQLSDWSGRPGAWHVVHQHSSTHAGWVYERLPVDPGHDLGHVLRGPVVHPRPQRLVVHGACAERRDGDATMKSGSSRTAPLL